MGSWRVIAAALLSSRTCPSSGGVSGLLQRNSACAVKFSANGEKNSRWLPFFTEYQLTTRSQKPADAFPSVKEVARRPHVLQDRRGASHETRRESETTVIIAAG